MRIGSLGAKIKRHKVKVKRERLPDAFGQKELDLQRALKSGSVPTVGKYSGVGKAKVRVCQRTLERPRTSRDKLRSGHVSLDEDLQETDTESSDNDVAETKAP